MSSVEACAVAVLATVGSFGIAGPPPAHSQPAWVEQGPGPTLGGQTEGLPGNPVSGGISAIAASASDPDLIYVAAVNGGVWKTTNATSTSPAWTPLTDTQLPASSMNSLALSPVDPNILLAGTGSTSSLSFLGSSGFGIAVSRDGGATWTVQAAATFSGRRVNSVVPTTLDNGNVVLAATLWDGGGVFRSTDMANTFTRVSGDGLSGLPNQGVSSLVGDPGNPSRYYAAVPAVNGATGSEGVYRSDDGGASWAPLNAGLSGLNTSLRILLSVHNNAVQGTNAVYAAIIANSGHLQGVYRSPNGGASWTAMGVPSPEIFPGGQGNIHGALVADPTNPTVVFISGDRQNVPLPNPNGCANFSGNVFLGDSSLLPGNPWQNVVCNGANGTSPHADSRAMVFDAGGNIVHSCDGGIYRLVDPNNVSGTRNWVSANGTVRPTEFHSVAYDPLSNIVFGGTQDVGTPIQSAVGNFTWNELLQGDGGNVAVDSDQTAHPGTTIRYTSSSSFGFFNRTTWDAGNNLLDGLTMIQLRIVSGPGTGLTLLQFDPNVQFYQPFVLNRIDPRRMLIGTANIYESMDRGDSLINLGFTGFFIGNTIGASPLAYGGVLNGTPNPDVLYVGAGPFVLHRVALTNPITVLITYPGGPVLGLGINPQNYQHVFVLDTQGRVWASFDEGVTWTNVTANLPSLSGDVRAIEVFSPDATAAATTLMVGGLGGVFQMQGPGSAGATWTVLGSGLPNTFVFDLHYNTTNDVLAAGTLGRGVWTTNLFSGGPVASPSEGPGSQRREGNVGGFGINLPPIPPVAAPGR